MFSLSIIRLFIFISLLTKVKFSSQAAIDIPNERLATIDDAGHFNTTSDTLMRRDHVLSKRVNGFSVSLTKVGNFYVALASASIDMQPFNVVFDTGSSNIVVAGANCNTCDGLRLYQPGTNKPIGSQVTIPYDAGDVVGLPYVGKVSINNGATYLSQPFIAASSIPKKLISNKIEGIFGMSLEPISATVSKNLPFYYDFFDKNKELNRLFAFSLGDSSGTFTIGSDEVGRDVSKTNKLPVIGDYTYWQVALSSIYLADKSMNIASATSILFDTGGFDFMVPSKDFENLSKVIPQSTRSDDQQYYIIPCNTKWDISFVFTGDSSPFVVPGENLMRSINGNDKDCEVLIRASEDVDELKTWIIGNPFLRTVYSRFTVGTPATASTPGSASFVGLVRV